MRRRFVGVACFGLGLFGPGLGGSAAQSPPMTPEFLVNSYTPGIQSDADIAMDHAGQIIVAWADVYQIPYEDGDYAVLARRFTQDGMPVGEPFEISGQRNAGYPALAASASGDFVVVWQNPHGAGWFSIFGRRYDSSGSPLGDAFLVNTSSTTEQRYPAIASDGSGAFVVTWSTPRDFPYSNEGIFARRFDSAGNGLGNEFRVNTYQPGNQVNSAVASDAAGNFVVVWESYGQDGFSYGVFGRRYDSSGVPLGNEFQVNEFTANWEGSPDVGFTPSGEFLVVGSGTPGGYYADVFARRYGSDGVPLGGEFIVNTSTTRFAGRPVVAANSDGFIVAWESSSVPDYNGNDVFAQRFDASGCRVGTEFQLNTQTALFQGNPAIAIEPGGHFAVSWTSNSSGTGPDVVARTGGSPEPQISRVDTRPSSGLSNVNGVLETGETVSVDPTWRNTRGFSIDLQSLAVNFVGPAGGTYVLDDAIASYGSIPVGSSTDCFTATGNCFEITVSGNRTAAHWDATFLEWLTTLGSFKQWTLHVGESFSDVPVSHPYYKFVENIFHNGITAGGACGAASYCAGDSTLRRQMAAFVLKAKEGPFYTPPPARGIFADVPASDAFAPWVEELYNRGVVAGCAAPDGLKYCPARPVLRQQMAVFLLKTLLGPDYEPPTCVGIFLDVPCSSPFAAWIEDLFSRQIAAGCGGGNYCPASDTTRGQMAPFLVKTFGLLLYGP